MPGASGIDDLINENTVNGKLESWDFYKHPSGLTNTNAAWQSFWTCIGSPGPGATPATTPGDTHTGTAGGMEFPNRSTDQKFLTRFTCGSTNGGTAMLYDRLASVSGISIASTGNKTVNSGSLPRYSGTAAKGVQCWLEVTTATTTTNPLISVNSYTDEDGNTGQAGGSRNFTQAACGIGSMFRMGVAAGTRGFRSVETINVATASATGVVNVVLLRPIAFVPIISSSSFASRDFIVSVQQYLRIFDGATLGLAFLSSSNALSISLWGCIRAIYG